MQDISIDASDLRESSFYGLFNKHRVALTTRKYTTMGDLIMDIITWLFMACAVVLYVLAFPFLLVLVLVFHDWEPVRISSIIAFLALDFVLFGDLTRKYATPPRWYYPPWRGGWGLKILHT